MIQCDSVVGIMNWSLNEIDYLSILSYIKNTDVL